MPENSTPIQEGDTGKSTPARPGIDRDRYGTWIDRLFGDEISRELLGRALGFGTVVFGIGFVFSTVGGEVSPVTGARAYLVTSTGYLISILYLLAPVSYVWGSSKFLSLWVDIRDAFAVEEDRYYEVVGDGLEIVYNDRAILFEFVTTFVVGWLLFRDFPRIPFGDQLLDHVGDLYVWVLNNVIGAIGLLYLVTAIHMVATSLYLLHRVTHLPFERPQTAVSELQPFGNFTAIVSTIWFLFVLFTAIIWHQFFEPRGLLEGPPSDGITSIGYNEFTVTGILVVLVFIGIVLFLVPQVSIHSALVERKRERFLELDEELELLKASLLTGERDHEEVSAALDLHNRQYRRAENARTWLFDFRGLLQVIGSGITAIVSVLLQADLLSGISL